MRKPGLFRVDAGTRGTIFAGVPMSVMALHMYLSDTVMRNMSDTVWVYTFWGAVMIVAVLGLLAYHFIPKRLIAPVGIACWVVFFAAFFWKCWFGSFAFWHPHG